MKGDMTEKAKSQKGASLEDPAGTEDSPFDLFAMVKGLRGGRDQGFSEDEIGMEDLESVNSG